MVQMVEYAAGNDPGRFFHKMSSWLEANRQLFHAMSSWLEAYRQLFHVMSSCLEARVWILRKKVWTCFSTKWSSSWESCNGSHVIHTSIKSSISWEFFIWLHWESRFLVVPGLKPRDMHLRSNQIQNSLRIPELIAVCLTCDQLLQNQILLKLVGTKSSELFLGPAGTGHG